MTADLLASGIEISHKDATACPKPGMSKSVNRILIIEDDATTRALLAAMLRVDGYLPVSREGLDDIPKAKYRAIVLDCHLAQPIDTNAIAAFGAPVVLVTATIDDEVSRLEAELGQVARIMKPVSKKDLVAAVESVSRKVSGSSVAVLIDQKRIDELRALASATGGDNVPSMIGRFVDDNPERLAELVDLARQSLPASLSSAAHQWKGLASTLGAAGLADVLARIEVQQSMDDAVRRELEDLVGQTDEALRAEFGSLRQRAG